MQDIELPSTLIIAYKKWNDAEKNIPETWDSAYKKMSAHEKLCYNLFKNECKKIDLSPEYVINNLL